MDGTCRMSECMKMRIFRSVSVILLLCIFCIGYIQHLHNKGIIWNLRLNSNESQAFRIQKLDEDTFANITNLSNREGIPMYELLSVWMPVYQFSMQGIPETDLTAENYRAWRNHYEGENQEALGKIEDSYEAVWADLAYFPVADSTLSKNSQTRFENSWMAERSYGGKRGHEGTDIMPLKNERGRYPVISMTSGLVEQVGWLKQGGYRIGIRSPHGGYFYYAHLSSYARQFKVGDSIEAGQWLGFMGDTGYSEVEGTTGNFDVHLHLGIYIRTANHEEISMNPYWVLRYLEGQKLKYVYEV